MTTPTENLFTRPEFKANPYPFFAQLRQEGPAVKTTLPNGTEVYLVTRYEDVQAGLKDSRLVKNIQNARSGTIPEMVQRMNSSSMLRADPPAHTRLRALAHEAFTPKLVNQMRGHIQHIADNLIDKIQAQGKMDLIADFAFPLPITVICEMLGVPTEDDQKFREWSGAMIASGNLSSENPVMLPQTLQLVQYLNQLIEQRRKEPQDDLISALIHADQSGDHLDSVELVGTTLVLLVAGHETTVNLIGSGMLALLQAPQQLEKLKQNPELIRGAVDELVRYVSPVQSVNRYAAEDMEISGTAIPKGAHLLLVIGAANHDAGYVENPEALDVTHSDTKHVAFGQGIHYCLGAPLARLEGEIAFTTLLRRLPNLHLAVGPETLTYRSAFELRGLNSLPVAF